MFKSLPTMKSLRNFADQNIQTSLLFVHFDKNFKISLLKLIFT